MIVGQVLREHYQVIKAIGKGNFGETYLAEDLDLPDRPYRVVKMLKPQASDPQTLAVARRLFDTEVAVLYKLGKHPQIPELFAHFEENNEFYLVQEYIEGYDLTTEINPQQTLTETEVIKLLQEILEVLNFVHQNNVIHRDIKPSNLMRRTLDNKLILIDFGAVKQISSATFNNQQNPLTVIIGTAGYIAPEQAMGIPQFNSDIYAVGMTAIQALTGILPHQFNQQNQGKMWQDHVNISDNLFNILTKMTCYNYEDRYQSILEILEDLKIFVPQTQLSLKPTKTMAIKLFFQSKFKFILCLVGMGLIVSAVLGLFPSLINFNPQNNQEQPEVIKW
jgi:serine/threonine protein kinase